MKQKSESAVKEPEYQLPPDSLQDSTIVKLHPSIRLEDIELIEYFKWVHWNEKIDERLKVIHHVPNERRCSWAQGKIMKQKGVRSGILDVNCPIPVAPHPGLWLEFKIKGNAMSENQIMYSKLLHSLGHCVRIAWSHEEAKKITIDYLKGRL